MKKERNKGDMFVTLWNICCVIVFIGFLVFSMIVGGSAVNGYQEAGKYFVGEHGRYVEVSETIWIMSNILEILFWVFILGSFVIFIVRENLKRR